MPAQARLLAYWRQYKETGSQTQCNSTSTMTVEPYISHHHIPLEHLSNRYTCLPVVRTWPMRNINTQLLQSFMWHCKLNETQKRGLLYLLHDPEFHIADLPEQIEFLHKEKTLPHLVCHTSYL